MPPTSTASSGDQHLVRNKIVDSRHGYGFSDGAQRGQRFALLHVAEERPEERW